jgi:hypothetical protein
MRFTPKTETECAEQGLLEKGEYDFEVVDASNEMSKARPEDGKESLPMIKLKVRVFEADGASSRTIFDYLIESFPSKLRHFCDASGILSRYEAGDLDAFQCLNKTGRCKVIVQKDKTGNYPPKNSIADYVIKAAPALKPAGSVTGDAPAHTDDDLPSF